MSSIAKVLLVATSLAPALGAFALIEFQNARKLNGFCLIFAAGFLVFLCWLLKLYPQKHGERQTLEITAVENTDKEALSFMIAYLFPILTGNIPNITNGEYWVLSTYVFSVIGLTVYHSNAFHFNPILALFGYHFYGITADSGMSYLLITRQILRVQNPDITVTRISDYVYLQVVDNT